MNGVITRQIILTKQSTSKNVLCPPKIGVIDWLLVIPFHAVFLSQFIVYDLLQRVALLFGDKALNIANKLLHIGYFNTLRLVGTRFKIDKPANLPKNRPLIIVSNHQSLFDIPILATTFSSYQPRFVAKRELAKWIPATSLNLRSFGHAIIDRKNFKQALEELSRVARLIEEQNSAIIIFPEGTRARDGILKKFRPAGLTTLIEKMPTALIVPVTIEGSWKLSLYKCLPIPIGTKVSVIVGDAIEASSIGDKTLFIESLSKIIANNLNQLRVN